jgi:hypothetical protein
MGPVLKIYYRETGINPKIAGPDIAGNCNILRLNINKTAIKQQLNINKISKE